MKKEGYRDATISGTAHALRAVTHQANLSNSESVKAYLARAEHISINRKEKICEDLDRYYKWKNIEWIRPHYHRVDVLPFVPNTQEVNDLIACLGAKMSVSCLLLKETGCRFGEGFSLRRQDIDAERNHVTITPLKGSNARQLKVSSRLIGLLNGLPKEWPTYVFRNPKIDFYRSSRRFRNEYMFQRRRASKTESTSIESDIAEEPTPLLRMQTIRANQGYPVRAETAGT